MTTAIMGNVWHNIIVALIQQLFTPGKVSRSAASFYQNAKNCRAEAGLLKSTLTTCITLLVAKIQVLCMHRFFASTNALQPLDMGITTLQH